MLVFLLLMREYVVLADCVSSGDAPHVIGSLSFACSQVSLLRSGLHGGRNTLPKKGLRYWRHCCRYTTPITAAAFVFCRHCFDLLHLHRHLHPHGHSWFWLSLIEKNALALYFGCFVFSLLQHLGTVVWLCCVFFTLRGHVAHCRPFEEGMEIWPCFSCFFFTSLFVLLLLLFVSVSGFIHC